MGSRNFDITILQARFEGLSDADQAAQWMAFIDALDAGDAGFHPYQMLLSPLYERGETPLSPERLQLLDEQAAEWDRAIAEWSSSPNEEVASASILPLAQAAEWDRLMGSPPF